MTTKIGIIADTHNYIDPMVFKIFRGVDSILHAGDIESVAIIEKLEEIAPVTAVSGNHESEEAIKRYTWITAVNIEDVKIVLTHQFLPLNIPNLLPMGNDWTKELNIEDASVLVYGHNHEPVVRRIGEVLYFNPGFAGPPKDEPLRTVGLLTIKGREVFEEVYFLSTPPGQQYFNRARIWKDADKNAL